MVFIRKYLYWACPLILSGCLMTAQATSDDMTDAIWVAEDINGKGVLDMLQSTIAIAADGSVTGMGGCNNFFGKANLIENQLSFGPLGSTRKLCAEAVNNQEIVFFKALSDVSSFELKNGLLYMKNSDDQYILRFWRKDETVD